MYISNQHEETNAGNEINGTRRVMPISHVHCTMDLSWKKYVYLRQTKGRLDITRSHPGAITNKRNDDWPCVTGSLDRYSGQSGDKLVYAVNTPYTSFTYCTNLMSRKIVYFRTRVWTLWPVTEIWEYYAILWGNLKKNTFLNIEIRHVFVSIICKVNAPMQPCKIDPYVYEFIIICVWLRNDQ